MNKELFKRIRNYFFLTTIVLFTSGCWPILGHEESFLKAIPEHGLYTLLFWILIILVAIDLLIRAVKVNMASLKLGVIFIIISMIIAYTILGSFSYWFFTLFADWNIIGIIIIIIGAFLTGLAKGFYGVIPIALYIIYHDPRLLYYLALPALIGDIIEALILKKPTVLEKGDI